MLEIRGRLVLDDRIAPGQIAVDRGRISSVEFDSRAADGPYIAPGFVDVHVHGWGGHDAMAGSAALDGMARALLRRGVTSFVPTAVTASLPTLVDFGACVRRWMPAAPGDGAEPLGFNLEGPFISPAKMGAQNPAFVQVPEDVATDSLELLLDGLRIMTVAPELPGALVLLRWLDAHGVAGSLGHSAASAAEASAGYAAGARTTTHLFNAMTGVDHHAPGLATTALTDDKVYVELVADGYHVDRDVWPLILRTKPAERLILVSDAIQLAGMGEGRALLGGLEVEVRAEQSRLASDGQLAGSVIALDSAVRNLARAGVSLPRAVAAASSNPLTLLGISDRGRLATGMRADFVMLDDELAVRRVMRGGQWFDGDSSGGTAA